MPPRAGTRLEQGVASAVRIALDAEEGDLLVFLPGAGEIRRVERSLQDVGADVIPLHGNLPADMQDRAILPSLPGTRKVVLATSIAETSLTIEGVRVVVDGGLSRVPRYSPRTGMTRLATVRVSRASAEQRRGRAGRLAPGICYRLWSRQEDAALPERSSPEMLEADLTPLALDLAAAGIRDPGELLWIDPPPAAAYSQARSLLVQLGAIESGGVITRHGAAMRRLALHPRLSHMVMKGTELGVRGLACELAALLTERDLLGRSGGVPEADIRTRLDLLRGSTLHPDTDREALRRARVEATLCHRGRPGTRGSEAAGASVGVLLALAYPDRVAQRRPGRGGRYLLRNGVGAFLEPQSLSREEYLVAPELDGRSTESRILVAARLTWKQRAALDRLAPTHVVVPSGSRIPVDYGEPGAPVLAVRLQEMFGLAETPRVGGGAVPLTLHLLSPAGRPVQVTRDLAGFWRTTYFDVRKDLKGRYPKHFWPNDPLGAEPSSRARRNK
ncbi:hypothetical protein BH24GEM1_BH24GEM1_19440 [soil metagenome]